MVGNLAFPGGKVRFKPLYIFKSGFVNSSCYKNYVSMLAANLNLQLGEVTFSDYNFYANNTSFILLNTSDKSNDLKFGSYLINLLPSETI